MQYLVVIEKADTNYAAYAPDVPGCIRRRRHGSGNAGQLPRGLADASGSDGARRRTVAASLLSTSAMVAVALPAPALAERNKNVVVIIGIESVPAAENLDAILDVGGIDAIFIGPNDLSISLGLPDQYSHPRFLEVTEHIINTAQARGIPAGGHWQTEEDIERWMAKGSRFVLFSTDGRALMEGYRHSLNKFRTAGTSVGAMEHTI